MDLATQMSCIGLQFQHVRQNTGSFEDSTSTSFGVDCYGANSWQDVVRNFESYSPCKMTSKWIITPIGSMYGIFHYIYHKCMPKCGYISHTWILWDTSHHFTQIASCPPLHRQGFSVAVLGLLQTISKASHGSAKNPTTGDFQCRAFNHVVDFFTVSGTFGKIV